MRLMLACLLLVVSTTALSADDQAEADELSDQMRADKRRVGLRIPNIVYLKNSMPTNDIIKRRIGLRIPNIIYLQNQAKKDELAAKRKRRIGLRIPNIVYLRNPNMYNGEEGKQLLNRVDVCIKQLTELLAGGSDS